MSESRVPSPEFRATLEDFLANKPLSPRIAALMRGEEEAENSEPGTRDSGLGTNFADGTPITDPDREHLRRLLHSPGWGVLLKLLDRSLAHREDAARRISLAPATAKELILEAWAEVAAARRAREALVLLVESEIAKLKAERRGKVEQ